MVSHLVGLPNLAHHDLSPPLNVSTLWDTTEVGTEASNIIYMVTALLGVIVSNACLGMFIVPWQKSTRCLVSQNHAWNDV